MTATSTSTRMARRRRASYSFAVQQQSVANIVLNSAAVVVDVLKQQEFQRTLTNQGTSTPFFCFPSAFALPTLLPPRYDTEQVRSHWNHEILNSLRRNRSESSYMKVRAVNCTNVVNMALRCWCHRIELFTIPKVAHYITSNTVGGLLIENDQC